MSTQTDIQSAPVGQPATPSKRRSRTTRLLFVWLLAGVLAAAGSAAWASTFATASAEIGDTAESEPVIASEASTSVAPEWMEAGPDVLTIDFQGTWAQFNADARMFEVDVSDTPADQVFQIGVYSTADLDDSGWTDLQLEFVIVDGPCDTADLSAPDEAEALNLLASSDAAWMVAMDGGSTACIGVPASGRADDADGTFARRANAASEPTPPTFTASANRIE